MCDLMGWISFSLTVLCEKAFDLVVNDIRMRHWTHVAKVSKLVDAHPGQGLRQQPGHAP